MTQPYYLRADTSANWTSVNPVLADGEPGVEIVSTNPVRFKLKIGDGVSAWSALDYANAGGGGATGATGAQGPAGPEGPTGPAGRDGSGFSILGTKATSDDLPVSGTAGDAWITEADGHLSVWPTGGSAWLDVGQVQGPAGPTGPTGAAGPTGPAGATGATGARGLTGAAGPTGAAGATGPAGSTGATGAKGDKGDTGAAGTGGDPTLGGTYGGDSTGATYSDSALAAAKAAGVKRLRAEAGTFKFANKIPIDFELDLYGDGPNSTFFDSYTTTDHGMEVAPASAGSRTKLRDFTLRYKGAGQAAGKHGLLVKRKVFAENVVVQGFTGSGIRFDSFDGTVSGSVFFSVWTNCRSTLNGLDGLEVRFGANGNIFNNFLGDKNGRYGVHHYTDGGATYANKWDGGQASYNVKQGWFMESGTDIKLEGVYGEYNCSPNNTNTLGYTNSTLSATDRRVDFHFGDSVTRVKANLSAVLNNDATHIRTPTKATSFSNRVDVAAGGLRYTPLCAAISASSATTLAGLLADHNALVAVLNAGKVTGG